MKFVMIREFEWDLSKDKLVIGEVTKDYICKYVDGTEEPKTRKYKISLAYLSKMGSFNENEEYNVLLNTDSVQIRPKAIYKNDQGYYRKEDGKRLYLGDEHTEEVENAIEKFQEYLKEHPDLEENSTDYRQIW